MAEFDQGTSGFVEDLQQVLNKHSAESVSGTPDFILAELLQDVLKAYNAAVVKRADWRGESTELPALQRLSYPDDSQSIGDHDHG